MNEELVNKVNVAFDHLMARIENDIKNAPVEDLEHVAHTLLQLMDFKNAMQQADGNQAMQERIMRSVKQKIDRGEFGIGFGDMPPGFPQPPQPPQN